MTLAICGAQGQPGEFYGHLAENAAAGVPRGLFWNLSLPCVPISWEQQAWDCTLLCGWLQWPVQDWTHLDGASLHTCVDPASVECAVDFGGILVVPANVFPKPDEAADVIHLVEPFLDLSKLDHQVWDRFRYVLRAQVPQA